MAPVAIAARHLPRIHHRLIATGQQDELFDSAIAEFGVTVDVHLGHHPGGGAREAQLSAMEDALTRALRANPPALILVQGDTNTALAAAQAAHRNDIPVGHVEAGLRSHDLTSPFPEELNRVQIAQLATLHFAPSEGAAENLRREGINDGIFVTGNPGIDALMMCGLPQPTPPDSRKILVTCHRRENFGAPLQQICRAIRAIADRGDVHILFPLHANPIVAAPISAALAGHPMISLIAPLPYRDMIAEMAQVSLVLSDSGGLQEECAAIGVPMLLMRNETERPEVVSSGNCKLVGCDADIIIASVHRLLDDPLHRAHMSGSYFPYGNGKAAPSILTAVQEFFAL
jgi:UDP-N-acetylglucosamine 2-epimerase (non-hydrolysing)